ncbi:MAG: HAD hydrolase-like protein [Clostridia bacterium]|nr:HAD hydrolase-like protein [Clostridia bacterium]
MKKYRYILFDLDGTLTLSHPGIFYCLSYTLEKMGYPEAGEEAMRKWIGPPITQSFQEIFKMSDERAAEATKIYRKRYGEVGWEMNERMPFALEALRALKSAGYTLALATSKPKIFSDKITEKFGFSEYLTVEVGCGVDGSFPTKASVIKEAVRLLGADEKECLMVGDRKHDILGARECGIAAAGLRVGYALQGELEACEPEYIFENFQELTTFLLG